MQSRNGDTLWISRGTTRGHACNSEVVIERYRVYIYIYMYVYVYITYIPMRGRIKEGNWVITKISLGDN